MGTGTTGRTDPDLCRAASGTGYRPRGRRQGGYRGGGEGKVNCDYCGGVVAPDADRCPHCGTKGFWPPPSPPRTPPEPDLTIYEISGACVGLIAGIVLWNQFGAEEQSQIPWFVPWVRLLWPLGVVTWPFGGMVLGALVGHTVRKIAN